MSRSMERHEETMTNNTWIDLVTAAANHKLEVINWSVFSAATTAIWYLGILRLDTSTNIIDELHMPNGFNALKSTYNGVPIYEGEKFRAFISATGFVAASTVLSYVDVDYT